MTNVSNLIAANDRRWHAMHFKASRLHEFDTSARRLISPASKARYMMISHATGVPWGIVGVVHLREGGGSFLTYLGNGQSLSRVTTLVPAGRGPFLNHANDPPGQDAFFRGAIDALELEGALAWGRTHGWGPASACTFTEKLNGYGYANKGLPSSYVWGGTNEQHIGKYVRDGVWDGSVWDTQLGTAGLLRYMSGLDPSVGYSQVLAPPPPVEKEPPVVTPVTPAPTPVVQVDLASVWKLVSPFLPALLSGVATVFPPAAPLVLVFNAVNSIMTKLQGSDGSLAAVEKIVADEMYAVAVQIDPTLKHTT
jgi:lysozyme family protein